MNNYCKTCVKKVPTVKVGDDFECMICGTKIEDAKEGFVNKITSNSLKEVQNLTKINPDTGKFMGAAKVGRNVIIGISIILAGILYSIGGLTLVAYGFGFIVIFLILISIFLYFVAILDRGGK